MNYAKKDTKAEDKTVVSSISILTIALGHYNKYYFFKKMVYNDNDKFYFFSKYVIHVKIKFWHSQEA